MIHFEEITHENWRLVNRLKVSEEQKHYVAPNVTIQARAYAYRYHRSQAKIIYRDETMVGLLMYRDCEELKCYVLDQMMIDEAYQGRGNAKEAVALLIKDLKEERKYDNIQLCYCEGNDAAKNLYERLGFKHTGEIDEDEVIMILSL